MRDPRRWYRSVRATIYQVLTNPEADPIAAERRAMAIRIILEGTFGGQLCDEEHALQVFERHNQAVQREVPPERLLVFDVAEGWEPLCRFLGRGVPDDPFPRVNTTEEFRQRAAERQRVDGAPS